MRYASDTTSEHSTTNSELNITRGLDIRDSQARWMARILETLWNWQWQTNTHNSTLATRLQ
jgi:hypothetical protein